MPPKAFSTVRFRTCRKTLAKWIKNRLTAAYKIAILEHIVPTYQKLGEFLQDEYLPKARTTSGVDALPQGGGVV
jgi:uncharacterized protein (DUF885 family)